MSHLSPEEQEAIIEALRKQKVHPSGYALNDDNQPLVIEDGLNEHALELERLMCVASPYEADQAEVDSRLARCYAFIEKGTPCERVDILDQAIVSFIHGGWQPRFDAQFAQLFATYVERGYIHLERPIRTHTKPGMYQRLNDKLPLVAATYRGKFQIAELLIENGADVGRPVEGLDFFEWARANAGQELETHDAAWCGAATARLLEASLRVRIARSAATEPVLDPPPARRARAL